MVSIKPRFRWKKCLSAGICRSVYVGQVWKWLSPQYVLFDFLCPTSALCWSSKSTISEVGHFLDKDPRVFVASCSWSELPSSRTPP